jgi:hypothetical protein
LNPRLIDDPSHLVRAISPEHIYFLFGVMVLFCAIGLYRDLRPERRRKSGERPWLYGAVLLGLIVGLGVMFATDSSFIHGNSHNDRGNTVIR